MLARIGARLDAWVNELTGFGSTRDKSTYSVFQATAPLLPIYLRPLYNGDDMVKKIVDLPVEEMVREGVAVKTDAPEFTKTLQRVCEEMKLLEVLANGAIWGRLYGGALVWIGADDGRDVGEPLGSVRSVRFLDIFDRAFAFPEPGGSITYPERYRLYGLTGGSVTVHKSRVIRFGGARTDDLTRRENEGWDLSILQTLLGPIQAFNEAFHAAGLMVTDASQAVMRMKGLLSALSGGHSADLRTRAQLLDMSRSVARMIMLDTDEEFIKVPTQFAGVSDVLGMAAKRLSAATGIPVAVLLGESPSGLQATGALDIRIFYDKVAAARRKILEPPLVHLLTLIARTMGYAGTVSVEWPSLWQESPQEQATRRKTVAETDQIYDAIGVLSPETIQRSRFGKGEWSPETELDPNEQPAWTQPQFVATQQPGALPP